MLRIKATTQTPSIRYNMNAGVLSIEGESYPENSLAFYEPILLWLRTTLPSLPSLRLKVKIRYMNTGSIHSMLQIIDTLREASEQGCDVRVTWYYEADDQRSRDLAEEFREDAYFPFDLAPSSGSNQ